MVRALVGLRNLFILFSYAYLRNLVFVLKIVFLYFNHFFYRSFKLKTYYIASYFGILPLFFFTNVFEYKTIQSIYVKF